MFISIDPDHPGITDKDRTMMEVNTPVTNEISKSDIVEPADTAKAKAEEFVRSYKEKYQITVDMEQLNRVMSKPKNYHLWTPETQMKFYQDATEILKTLDENYLSHLEEDQKLLKGQFIEFTAGNIIVNSGIPDGRPIRYDDYPEENVRELQEYFQNLIQLKRRFNRE